MVRAFGINVIGLAPPSPTPKNTTRQNGARLGGNFLTLLIGALFKRWNRKKSKIPLPLFSLRIKYTVVGNALRLRRTQIA